MKKIGLAIIIDIIMALCKVCLEEYSDKRRQLGYETCLDCGKLEAEKETSRKSKCIAPAYNKGAYQYIASVSDAKDAGK